MTIDMRGVMVAADFGGGLFVRADRRGKATLAGVGVGAGAGAGAGDDSFRRLAGFGVAAVGDGVGNVLEAEVGADGIDTALGVLPAAAALPDRL